MNTFSSRRARTGSLVLASAALCLTLFSVPAIAQEKPAAVTEKPVAAAKDDRLISIVVLFPKPQEMTEHTLGTLISKALGIKHSHDEARNRFVVVAKPPYFLVKLKSGSYVINNVAEPYVAADDKMLDDIKDPELRKALAAHHAWVSIDWAAPKEPADVQHCYQDMGKIAAAIAGKDALAIYNPDLDDFTLYSEPVAKSLCCEDPLTAFPGGSDTVSIRDDDPQLKAAQAEAKKGWPDFVKAFRGKAGTAFAVKGRITEGDDTEYMWLAVDAIDEAKVHGRLDNEPSTLTKLKIGQDLHITLADVDDWTYLNSEKQPVGGFTSNALSHAADQPADQPANQPANQPAEDAVKP